MDKREFENPFPDPKHGELLLNREGKLSQNLAKRVHSDIEKHLKRLRNGVENEVDDSDYSVYTGMSGIALLHFHLYSALDGQRDDKHLRQALFLVEDYLQELKHRRLTFLTGDAGPLALGAVLYDLLGCRSESTDCINKLQQLHKEVVLNEQLPDEFLFGRSGYLYSLLFVRHYLGDRAVDPNIIDKVFKAIIDSGQLMSVKEKSQSPLMFEWHEKKYLGGAHGLAGIFYTLMQVRDPQYKSTLVEVVKPSIDFMMSLRFPSGNFPSSIGSAQGDKLVHWCHGAPGWIYMFIEAYKVFGEKKYLDEARSCAEVIWTRGLLKKGYGLCHGVSGNAYGFLAMFQLTHEQMYLYRAVKFAEWCHDYGKHNCRTPDHPYSLYEGVAGMIYFLADILDPQNARLPGFQL